MEMSSNILKGYGNPQDYKAGYPGMKEAEDVLVLNVGGVCHQICLTTLQKYPETRLGQLESSSARNQPKSNHDEHTIFQNKLYFDRNPDIFVTILDFYRSGKLHFKEELCPISFLDELEFWKISESSLSPCCQQSFYTKKLHVTNNTLEEDNEDPANTSKVWNLLDNPSSSIPARIYYIVSLLFVLLYLLAMTLNTMPRIMGWDQDGNPVDNPILTLIQVICIFFCSFEFILRLLFSPNKIRFINGWMNILDFIIILHYCSTLVFVTVNQSQLKVKNDSTLPGYEVFETTTHYNTYEYNEEEEHLSSKLLKKYVLLRVIWIFKLVRYSSGLQTVASTLRSSYKEVFLLFQMLVVGVFFFGSLAYYVECEESETGFLSLPQSFWWAIITMTTVGYGDVYPTSDLGRVVASFCAVFGVLCMVLPITLIAINFAGGFRKKENERKLSALIKLSRNKGNI